MNFNQLGTYQVSFSDINPTLKKLISIPSVSGSEHNIAEFLEAALKKLSLTVDLVETPKSGPSIFAFHDYAKHGPRLLFYAHTDTVNVVNGWKHPPFKPIIDGVRLYGLGAADMKGGLTAILTAVSKLVKMNLSGSLALAFVSDEEVYSYGCNSLINSGKLKGVSAGISAEPCGLSVLVLGRFGRAVYEFLIQGCSSHAHNGKPAANAIDEACRIVLALQRRYLGASKIAVLSMSGGTDYLSIPDSSRMLVDRHIKLGETRKAVLEEMINIVEGLNPKCQVKISFFRRPTPYMNPYRIKSSHMIVKVVEKACLKVRKIKPRKITRYSVGDENYLVKRAGIPMVTIGPEGGNLHAADEYVNLPSIVDAANIYICAATEFLKLRR